MAVGAAVAVVVVGAALVVVVVGAAVAVVVVVGAALAVVVVVGAAVVEVRAAELELAGADDAVAVELDAALDAGALAAALLDVAAPLAEDDVVVGDADAPDEVRKTDAGVTMPEPEEPLVAVAVTTGLTVLTVFFFVLPLVVFFDAAFFDVIFFDDDFLATGFLAVAFFVDG